MTVAPPRPVENLWPGLDRTPTGPRARLAARVAERIFRSAVGRLPVTVHLGGVDADRAEVLGLGGPAATIHRPAEFFARVGTDALIGFGESYLTGAWDSEDLGGFLTVLAADVGGLVPRPLQALRHAWVHRPPAMHRNTETNTRDNIAHHYDLSNDLFRLFLDPTLSYSSALFPSAIAAVVGPGADAHSVAGTPTDTTDLAGAQVRKIERLLDEAGVVAGSRVLEVGTGWGELAIRAAARGAVVRSITLSTQQQDLARERIAAAGHADRVDVDLCDYRAVQGTYDAVLSVEMVEAVGHEYWSTYFATLDRVLAPGGRVALQAITMPHDRMLATRSTHTWINKYIFPGGFLPSVRAIDEITRRDTSLRVVGRLSMGSHYAETLRQWDDAFRARADEVRALGFDATFERMWHFYLEYSRAGVASGYLDVQQLLLERVRP